MAKTRKKPRRSLFRRMLYLIMVVSGGSSGWLVKDYPGVQAVWSLVTGKPVPTGSTAVKDAEGVLAAKVSDLLNSTDQFDQPGTYQVTIPKVHLDSHLFKVGHTVDIQARVLKVEPNGRPTTLWETKPYGERLAVAGKDDLIAGWPQRPFQVDWNPGDRLMVEVYDRRTLPFFDPKKFTLAPSDPEPREFPLKPGTFPLEAAQKPDAAVDPRNNNIVLQSLRVGNLQGQRPAESPARRDTVGIGSRDASPPGDDGTIVIK
ncbi:MAG: hypothetical protein ACLQGP_29140 [Isosphaeraceae bacterium]